MESLQFVGCSWFIGLIGLGFRFTQNKSTSTELCALPRPFPVSSSTHLDAPGVPSTAHCGVRRARTTTGTGVLCARTERSQLLDRATPFVLRRAWRAPSGLSFCR